MSDDYPLAREVVGFRTVEEMLPLTTMTIHDALYGGETD
jgi:hypothetical protein